MTDSGYKGNFLFRFKKLAVSRGYVTEKNLTDALSREVHNEPCALFTPYRLIENICTSNGWMTPKQIEMITAEIFREYH